MDTAYDAILTAIRPGASLRTPDAAAGKPFTVLSVDPEAVVVRTAKGGKVRISLFTFDTAVKFLRDRGCFGDRWIEAKDEEFQALLDMENDRVRAASYVLGILKAAGLVDVDGSRPNRVRLAAGR